MSKKRIDLYEGLFLMGAEAGSDLPGALAHVQEILNRADAEILILRKWDERRLAYPVNRQKRGVYLLAYFNVDRSRMVGIERDCNLSEKVARMMAIRADHMGEAEMTSAYEDDEKAKTEAALRAKPETTDEKAPDSTKDKPAEESAKKPADKPAEESAKAPADKPVVESEPAAVKAPSTPEDPSPDEAPAAKSADAS